MIIILQENKIQIYYHVTQNVKKYTLRIFNKKIYIILENTGHWSNE